MYLGIIAVVCVTSVINVQKIVETHNMLNRLEHWEELDEEEKEAMETLKFIEKAHQLLHEHDHLGLGKTFCQKNTKILIPHVHDRTL